MLSAPPQTHNIVGFLLYWEHCDLFPGFNLLLAINQDVCLDPPLALVGRFDGINIKIIGVLYVVKLLS